MEIMKQREMSVATCAAKAVEVLRAGGLVVYPTDTLYGLGADALSDEAVAKIYALKEREAGKPIHCIVADIMMAERFAIPDQNARVLAKTFLPGPLTLILKKRATINTGIARHMETIGIRIPRSELCIEMARVFGRPITTTSANVSGKKPERTIDGILAQFGDAASAIDLAIDAGELPPRAPSTLVDTSAARPVILREGAISTAEIWEALRTET